MRIGIIDADLAGRDKHRFPNLACEKISGYHKDKGDTVELVLSYDNLDQYDVVYISKVFTDTPVPYWVKNFVEGPYVGESFLSFEPEWIGSDKPKINIGGTGFYFDKAPNLPDEIEHHMPDYHLYDDWIANEVERARREKGQKFSYQSFMVQFKEYTDYSIGFLTRGCFRKCKFCVNQKYDHVFPHSTLEEFYDPTRPKICFLDDNFFGYPHWKELFEIASEKNKPFKFKQGLDERIMTEDKFDSLFSATYDGDYTFAFDNVKDYDLIHSKLKILRKHTKSTSIKFYVLVGFESTDYTDIENAFKRIELLMRYKCLPYIMRYQDKCYQPWKESKYRGMYVTLARWCNQPSFFKKKSFRQFCEANQEIHKTKNTYCSSMNALIEFENEHPDIANKYFDLRYADFDFPED